MTMAVVPTEEMRAGRVEAGPRGADAAGAAPRAAYHAPRLVVIGAAGELLEALGPAQAGYGGPGG